MPKFTTSHQSFSSGIASPAAYHGVAFLGLSYKEDKKGKILTAFDETTSSGKLIHSLLQSSTKEITLLNLVRLVPKDTNGKLRYPSSREKEEGREILKEEIKNYAPQLIFLCGKEVADCILKQPKVVKIDDGVYSYWATKLLPIEHPSYIAVYRQKYKHEYIDKILTLMRKYAD